MNFLTYSRNLNLNIFSKNILNPWSISWFLVFPWSISSTIFISSNPKPPTQITSSLNFVIYPRFVPNEVYRWKYKSVCSQNRVHKIKSRYSNILRCFSHIYNVSMMPCQPYHLRRIKMWKNKQKKACKSFMVGILWMWCVLLTARRHKPRRSKSVIS